MFLAMSAEVAAAYKEDEETHVQAASIVLKLRGMGISDRAVLRAIETVPRSLFVPEKWRHHAYSDHELPIECGQTISAPSVIGLTTASLDVSDRHGVLEIGTGSGYQTVILSRLARRVTSIDRFRSLVKAAELRWQLLGIRNISGLVGDGALGWSRQAPFDRILVSAACAAPPTKLIAQLSDAGILIAPIGGGRAPQRLTLFQRIGKSVDTRDLGQVRFLPLISGVAQNL
jgi:protein-L-isoaspartate(D-aspartate) O-methyltransferase